MKTLINRRRTIQLLGAAVAVPGELAFGRSGNQDAQVIVIGAGVSGLNTALILEEQGLDVLILEGSNRIGGRVYTLDDKKHKPNAGANELSAESHPRTVDMAKRLGLAFIPWLGPGTGTGFPAISFYINGKTVAMEQWATSPANKIMGKTKSLPPIAQANAFFPKQSPLEHLGSWLEPEAAYLDTSYYDYLQQQNIDPEALRIIQERHTGKDLREVSTLWQLRLQRLFSFREVNTLFGIEGGTSRLTDGMTTLLKRNIDLNTKVTGIRVKDEGVEIKDSTGRTYKAQYVVCTTPLTMLREITIEPTLPELHAAAVEQIPYDENISVFLDIKEPFWEKDGLPPIMWAEGTGTWVKMTRDPEGHGYYWISISGNRTKKWQDKNDDIIVQDLIDELAKIRPSSKGKVEPIAVQNWHTHPWTKGHGAYLSPGQIKKFSDILTKPFGRLYFAGTHTARLSTGMEGAMEAGERAALDILLNL